MFLDESGVLMAPLVRRSWAPAGQTPVLYQRGAHHRKVSVIAALCVSPERDQLRFYFRLHAADISAPPPHPEFGKQPPMPFELAR